MLYKWVIFLQILDHTTTYDQIQTMTTYEEEHDNVEYVHVTVCVPPDLRSPSLHLTIEQILSGQVHVAACTLCFALGGGLQALQDVLIDAPEDNAADVDMEEVAEEKPKRTTRKKKTA